MRIVSIDPSLHSTGIFWIDDIEIGDGHTCVILNGSGDRIQSIYRIWEKVWELCEEHGPFDIGIVEGYAFNVKGSQSLTVMAEVGAAVRLALTAHGVRIVEVAPASWKSKSIGFKLKKKTVEQRNLYLAAARAICGRTFKTTDEADAMMMYRATRPRLDA